MASTQAIVIAGHGSHHDPASAEPVYAHADRIRSRNWFDHVRVAFWKEQPSLSAVRQTVEADSVFVVPMLTSGGYFAERVFPRELGFEDGPSVTDPDVTYTEPVGTHDRLGSVITRRALSTPGSLSSEEVTVVLVGHGTPRHDRSGAATEAHARRLRAAGRFAEVVPVFLDQEPAVADVLDQVDVRNVVVVPLFVSNGHHVRRDVPAALGLPADDEPFGGPTAVGDHRVWYTEAIGTAPDLTEVILERAVEAGAKPGYRQTESSDAESAFLRWLETAEGGQSRRWGELVVTARPHASADPTYTVRPIGDTAVPRDEFEALGSPEAVRNRTRRDQTGAFRPLRTARSLPAAWVFETDDPVAFVRAVRAVYPASISHWHAARRGALRVRDFETVIGRQAGRYRELDQVDRETRSAAVEACCGHCVRQPGWATDCADAAATGESIPCPEPCSFLLEATRSFAEDGPSQPDTTVDPSVPAAAFDRPGNRYRVRFERALQATDPTSEVSPSNP